MGSVSTSTAPKGAQQLIDQLQATGQIPSEARQQLLEIAVASLLLHLAAIGLEPPAEALAITSALGASHGS